MDAQEKLGVVIKQINSNFGMRLEREQIAQQAHWTRNVSALAKDRVVLDVDGVKKFVAAKGDAIAYEVYRLGEYVDGIKQIRDRIDVACDITILNHGVMAVDGPGELFMTYGHDHEAPLGEIYGILAGRGSLAIYHPKTLQMKVVKMGEGDEFYIPPDWVHRFYCGEKQGVALVGFVPYKAGHRYETVKGMGFPYHILYDEKNGKTLYRKNPEFGESELEVISARSRITAVDMYFNEPEKLKKKFLEEEF